MLKSKFKKVLSGIFAILIIVATVGLIYFWETYGKSKVLYQETYVSARHIEVGETISEDMFKVTRIDGQAISPNSIQDLSQVVGKVALVPIPENIQISETYFIESQFYQEEGKNLMKIPSDWILSMPSTVRRGDVINLYPVKQKNANDVYSYETVQTDYVAQFVVQYAKSSGAKEVTGDRIGGAEQAVFVEVYVSTKEMIELNQFVQKGNKFIITYK